MDTFAAIQQVVASVFSDGKREVENILLPSWENYIKQSQETQNSQDEFVKNQWWQK